jgi:hypothetical protein
MTDNIRRIITGVVCILYLALLGYTLAHHELWGDEIHSWNIVKASPTLGALFSNIRYEGHPPVWYLILWPLSKFTHRAVFIQLIQFCIAGISMGVVLYRSPFPWAARLLIPFGYLFFFEYAGLSRNYAIGVLLAWGICMVLNDHRFRGGWYYLLLLLLSNTHLLGLLLAASFQAYLLLRVRFRWTHIVLGFLVLLPAVYFILPPPDSQLGPGLWVAGWNLHRLNVLVQAPLRAFMPMPAWWEAHFWNTQFLLEAGTRWLVVGGALAGVGLAFIALRDRAARLLFGINLALTLCAGCFFPLTSARYTGFIFVGFLAAYWLQPPRVRWALVVLLLLQIPGGLFAAYKDWHYPFSLDYEAPALVKEVPAGESLVCDYWALNPLAAFTDSAYYCIDLRGKRSFLKWDAGFADLRQRPDRYSGGFEDYFERTGLRRTYLISTASPAELTQADGGLFNRFGVSLIDARVGAIEKGGDLYLYLVEKPAPLQTPAVQAIGQRHP